MELITKAAVPPSMIFELTSLLKVCLKLNILCQFNNSIYKLPLDIGIPIGSTLGLQISEVCMYGLEEELFQSGLPLLTRVSPRQKNVDDILRIWTRLEEYFSTFVEHLNSPYPSITFTIGMRSRSLTN